MSLNKVMLIGHAGKDPEIRYVGSVSDGTKCATFSLATTEKYRASNGEVKEITEWHNIVVWRSLADVVEKYVRKGTQVFIEGKIKSRVWDDDKGNRRYNTDIIADRIQLLGGKPDPAIQGARQMTQQAQQQQAQQPQVPQPGVYGPQDDDDLPF